MIYKAATTLPDSVANAIFKAVTTNSNVAADAKSALTTAYDSVYDAGIKLYGSVYTNTYFDFAGALLGLVILVITMLFLALSIGIVLATKLMLLITLSLAPLFIILALFRYTFAFTDGYLRLLANLMTSMVLLYAFIGFYIQLLDLAIQYSGIGSQAATAGDKIERVVPFIFACLVGFYVCMQIPSMASAIAGGIIDSTGAGRASVLSLYGMVQNAFRRLKPSRPSGRPTSSSAATGAAAPRRHRLELGPNRLCEARSRRTPASEPDPPLRPSASFLARLVVSEIHS